jgi:excinuclease ABC subunit B
MYADAITDSMSRAIQENNRRRAKQIAYNEAHNITPQTIIKPIEELVRRRALAEEEERLPYVGPRGLEETIEGLREEMRRAAQGLEFERAAMLRDMIESLESGG